MYFRTDLALEMREAEKGKLDGVRVEEKRQGGALITIIEVENETGEKVIGKPVGRYITIELPPLTDNVPGEKEYLDAISEVLYALLPPVGPVLVCGLGNQDITPDALGPQTISRILATRHIIGEIERSAGLHGMRSVAALAPGVLGQTGMEVAEILEGMVEHIKPVAVIVVDALASRRLSRLGCTVQIANSGISPGSGINNARPSIDQKTLGVPVIAVGVPIVHKMQYMESLKIEGHSLTVKNKAGPPKGEKIWASHIDQGGATRYITTSKINNRNIYFLYEV